MGCESSRKSSIFLSKYNEVTSIKESSFGLCTIYRKKQLNYDYLIVMKRQVIPQLLLEIEQQFAFLTGQSASYPFLRVYHVQTEKIQKQSKAQSFKKSQKQTQFLKQCRIFDSEKQQINICMQYLTFSLKKHLQYKKSSKIQFSLSQYAYIIRSVLRAAQLYQQWNLTYLQLTIKSELILITPQGQIKLVPFQSRFLTEETPTCCASICKNEDISGRQITSRGEFHVHSGRLRDVNLKKYTKQIKLLSNQIVDAISTVNIRAAQNSKYIFQKQKQTSDHNKIISTHNRISKARSLIEIASALDGIQDDFINIKQNQSEDYYVSIPQKESSHSQYFQKHYKTIKQFNDSNQQPTKSSSKQSNSNFSESFDQQIYQKNNPLLPLKANMNSSSNLVVHKATYGINVNF